MELWQKRANQARNWLKNGSVILDCETTGLDKQAEVVQIGVVDCSGQILLDSLVKPSSPIPLVATRIHGIGNADVADAPTWDIIHDEFCAIVNNRPIVIYNAEFDTRILKQTMRKYRLRPPRSISRAECAMIAYSEYYDSYVGARWKKLEVAAKQQGVGVDGSAHSAVTDSLLTLGVIKAMAAKSQW